jgi:hypothetical protein
MGDIIESTVNADQGGFVDQPQTTETVDNTNVESVQGEAATPQQESNINNVQSADVNSQYAKIRREAEQKAQDKLISEMYGQSHNIHTYSDYQNAIKEQQRVEEANQKGIDPQFYSDFQSIKEQLQNSQREAEFSKQDIQLSSDPNFGDFYSQNKDEIHSLASQYNTDLDTAFTFMIRENFSKILNQNKIKAEQSAINNIINNNQTSTGALNSTQTSHNVDYSSMSSTDFSQLVQKALNGELMK